MKIMLNAAMASPASRSTSARRLTVSMTSQVITAITIIVRRRGMMAARTLSRIPKVLIDEPMLMMLPLSGNIFPVLPPSGSCGVTKKAMAGRLGVAGPPYFALDVAPCLRSGGKRFRLNRGLNCGHTCQQFARSVRRPATPDGGATGAPAAGVTIPGVGSSVLFGLLFIRPFPADRLQAA